MNRAIFRRLAVAVLAVVSVPAARQKKRLSNLAFQDRSATVITPAIVKDALQIAYHLTIDTHVGHIDSLPLKTEPSCSVDKLRSINDVLNGLRRRWKNEINERTITKLFEFKLDDKEASKSGSQFIPSSRKTSPDGHQWMLKSEDSSIADLLDGFAVGYVRRIIEYEDNDCLRSLMTRIAFAFKIECGKQSEIWIMMSNIHPNGAIPLDIPYTEYDLKHSRELDRCHRDDGLNRDAQRVSYKGFGNVLNNTNASRSDRTGYFGDLLYEFQDAMGLALHDGDVLPPGVTVAKEREKRMCFLQAMHMDALILKTKGLVDYSVLAFAQPFNGAIKDRHNVFNLGSYPWYDPNNDNKAKTAEHVQLVLGIIDLFKMGGYSTRLQSFYQGTGRTSNQQCPGRNTFLFGNKKFESYTEFFFCMGVALIDAPPGQDGHNLCELDGDEADKKKRSKYALKDLLKYWEFDPSTSIPPVSASDTCDFVHECRKYLDSPFGQGWLGKCRLRTSKALIGDDGPDSLKALVEERMVELANKPQWREFNIVVDRTDGQRLGVQTSEDKSANHLLLLDVMQGGAFHTWNEEPGRREKDKVKPGDMVIAINDVRGSAAKLEGEARKKKKLQVRIKKKSIPEIGLTDAIGILQQDLFVTDMKLTGYQDPDATMKGEEQLKGLGTKCGREKSVLYFDQKHKTLSCTSEREDVSSCTVRKWSAEKHSISLKDTSILHAEAKLVSIFSNTSTPQVKIVFSTIETDKKFTLEFLVDEQIYGGSDERLAEHWEEHALIRAKAFVNSINSLMEQGKSRPWDFGAREQN